MNNPIHDLTIGDKAPQVVTSVIEIPKGSHNKYEYDEERGVFALDRVLYSPMHYPLDYGFIPETRSEDGDHLDILVIGSDPTFTGCVLDARPIALLEMIDDGEEDFKILAVQKDNPRLDSLKTLDDIKKWSGHLLKEITHFMESYKHLQGGTATASDWKGADAAYEEIRRAQEMYKANK